MGRHLNWEGASRRDSVRERPDPKVKRNAQAPTEAQERYIRSLSRQLGISVPDGIVTRSGAASMIRDLKRRIGRKRS
jgi:hypothetical protein